MKSILYLFILSIGFSVVSGSWDSEERKEFLTQYEYGRALYNNPRGIGCVECHGYEGEGSTISYIKQKNQNKPIIAPNIKGISFVRLENALKNGKGMMPKYNLVASEMLALYIFLNPDFKQPK